MPFPVVGRVVFDSLFSPPPSGEFRAARWRYRGAVLVATAAAVLLLGHPGPIAHGLTALGGFEVGVWFCRGCG